MTPWAAQPKATGLTKWGRSLGRRVQEVFIGRDATPDLVNLPPQRATSKREPGILDLKGAKAELTNLIFPKVSLQLDQAQ